MRVLGGVVHRGLLSSRLTSRGDVDRALRDRAARPRRARVATPCRACDEGPRLAHTVNGHAGLTSAALTTAGRSRPCRPAARDRACHRKVPTGRGARAVDRSTVDDLHADDVSGIATSRRAHPRACACAGCRTTRRWPSPTRPCARRSTHAEACAMAAGARGPGSAKAAARRPGWHDESGGQPVRVGVACHLPRRCPGSTSNPRYGISISPTARRRPDLVDRERRLVLECGLLRVARRPRRLPQDVRATPCWSPTAGPCCGSPGRTSCTPGLGARVLMPRPLGADARTEAPRRGRSQREA